jgi:adenylylsulfate kinase-like enzyme
MRLIFLWGLPGSGKLTVAKELATLTGWRLFHNHLTVDLLLAAFPFGSKEFIDLRELIWLSVFAAAAAGDGAGLIFTFNPEDSVRQNFIEETLRLVEKRSGKVEFVEIVCDEAVLEKRLDTPERRTHKKLLSVAIYRELRDRGVFASPKMPAPHMRVDTTQQSPREAAVQIVEGLGLPFSGGQME